MTTSTASPPATATWKRTLFGVNAALAIFGSSFSFILALLGTYPSSNTNPTMLGNPDQGPVGRVLDYFTYFTIWSNILVAIIMTMLFLKPDRDSFVFRVLRLDSILMITVTGIVYNLVLSSTAELQGLEVYTNAFDHIVVPAATVIVWLLAGPRGWFSWRTVWASLVLPIIWLIWALIRGAFIGAYPYPFLDVATLGYPAVIVNVLGVVALAIVLALIFWGIDWLIRRATQRTPAPA